MTRLALLIPPPLIMLLAGLLMWWMSTLFPELAFGWPDGGGVAMFLGLLNMTVGLAEVVTFMRAGMTIDGYDVFVNALHKIAQ